MTSTDVVSEAAAAGHAQGHLKALDSEAIHILR